YGETHLTGTEAKQAIIDGINAGKLIVNYIGHGGTNLWASSPTLFTTGDIPSLTNADKLHVMLLMTCDNGKYSSPNPSPNADSIAEVITKTVDYGAVASWAPTGKGLAIGHKSLEKGFFDQLFNGADASMPIGLATTSGKNQLWGTGSNLDLLDTYLLFGDPATILRVPLGELEAPSDLLANTISTTQIDLSWTDNSDSESEFIIERSLTGTDGWEQIDTVEANLTSYSNISLLPGITYFYRVRAYRSGDSQYSDYSNVANATTEVIQLFLPLVTH
ncbi:MAG: C25 family cysteine peptidase, partial [Anaerolineales bacterium]